MADWRDKLGRWLASFVRQFGHKARRRMCPLYVAWLIGPGDRKSVGPVAERVAAGDCFAPKTTSRRSGFKIIRQTRAR